VSWYSATSPRFRKQRRADKNRAGRFCHGDGLGIHPRPHCQDPCWRLSALVRRRAPRELAISEAYITNIQTSGGGHASSRESFTLNFGKFK
jgi:hypothetical protein